MIALPAWFALIFAVFLAIFRPVWFVRMILRERDMRELRDWVAVADGKTVESPMDPGATARLVALELIDENNAFRPTELGRRVAKS